MINKTIININYKNWLITWGEVIGLEKIIKELLTVDGDLIYSNNRVVKSPFKVQLFQKYGFKLGLIRYLNNKLQSYQIVVNFPDIIDTSKKEELFNLFSLRDYQKEAIQAAIEKKYGIIKLHTATGKSRIAITLALLLPKPVVLIVPSVDLLIQFSKIFKEYKIKYGIIGGNLKIWDKDIMLVTNKSVIGKSKLLKDYIQKQCKTIIVDEVHHSTGKLYRFLGSCVAPFRFGFSATPYDKNWSDAKKLKLFANFGDVIYDGSNDDRIQVYREKPKVLYYKYYAKKLPTEFFNAAIEHNYIEQKRYGIVNNEERNILLLKIANFFRKNNMKVFIVVGWVNHIKNLQVLADKLNIPVYFLTGKDDGNVRNEIYSKMQNNENIIICGTVGGEGVDITTLNVVILGDVGKSEIKVIQNIGRSSRKDPNKKQAIAVDIQDAIFPKHIKKRLKIYEKENYEMILLSDYIKNFKEKKEM